eukprot:8584012-Heterocapsa_arctica.AAC.1
MSSTPEGTLKTINMRSGENMQQMTQFLRVNTETNVQHCRHQGIWTAHEVHAGHILCKKHCIKQDHHDKKWEYSKKQFRNHIGIDGEHIDSLAEIIGYKRSSPFMDTISPGKTKTHKRHLDMSNKSNNGVDTGDI